MVIIYMRRHAITRNKERRVPLQKLKNIMHFLTIDIDLLQKLDACIRKQPFIIYEAELMQFTSYLFITCLLSGLEIVREDTNDGQSS